MRWIKKNAVTLILLAVFLAGAGLIAYPTFSDWWNSFHQSRAVSSYAETVASMNVEEYDRIISEAERYNEELSGSGMLWTMTDEEEERYESLLKVSDTGIMGYIDIPKINITLPIYHGTDEAVLQVAIGHIEGSSLPVGGEGSHCVVSGHRGLPSARLFTDLDKMTEGDTFTLTVLNRTLTYEVDQIRTVEPTDLSDLAIEEGKDYCTLMTCTPYGINTHRLLVRGVRTENAVMKPGVFVKNEAFKVDTLIVTPITAIPLLIIALFLVFTHDKRQKRRSSKSGRKAARRSCRYARANHPS